jgi:hypothetical protein
VVVDQASAVATPVGAWEDDEAVFVELVVRDGDQRLVPAAVVPAQHALRGTLGGEQAEHALQVGRQVVLVELLGTHQAIEEAGGGKLLAVPHDHHLLAAGDRPQRVDRPHLAGLVEDDQVELQRARP